MSDIWTGADNAESRVERRWWAEKKTDRAAAMAYHLGTTLRERQFSDIERDSADFNSLYQGSTRTESPGTGFGFWGQDLPAFNVIQSVTDTLVSQLTRQKIRPFFQTSKGDYGLREKAENATRAVEANFDRYGIYGSVGRRWCLDGCIYGGGHMKTVVDYTNQCVRYERVWPWQLFVGHKDGQYGTPRTLYFVGSVSRAGLEARFENDKKILKLIQEAPAAPASADDPYEMSDPATVDDNVLVVEAWHLPSTRVDRSDDDAWDWQKAKHDGRHIITVGCEGESDRGGVIFQEAWPFDYFPVTNWAPRARSVGWRGQGVPETLLGIQVAVNRMAKRLDGILHMHARPLILVDRGAKVNTHQLTNDWATILEVSLRGGVQYITPGSVPADFIDHLERLVRWGYEQFGISSMAAQAKRPEGIESGVAIRTVLDNDSVRQSVPFSNWEDAHVQLARATVDGFRMLAQHSEGSEFEVVFGNDKDLKRLKWKDFDMAEEAYQLRPWPTNLLPQAPAARFEKVFELNDRIPGGLDRPTFVQMLGMPDVERAMSDQQAAADNIDRQIDNTKRTGQPLVVDLHMDLDLYMTRVIEAINRAEADGVGDSAAAQSLRQGLQDIKHAQDKLAAAMAPPMVPGAPGAPGAPPPPGVPPQGGIGGPPSPGAPPPAELPPQPQGMAAE